MAEPETQGGTAEAEPTPEQGPDISAIAERMDSFAQDMAGLKEAVLAPEPEYGYEPEYGQPDPYQQQFAGQPYQQQPFAGQPQQPYAGQPEYGQQPGMQPGQVPGQPQVLYDEWGNPVQLPPQQQMPQQQEQLPPWAQQLMEQTQGIQSQIERQQVLGKVAEFEARYPELKNPEVFTPAAEAAQQKALQMGRPDLAGDPEFVVMSWLADRAANSAGSETPAGSAQEMQLETPGGVAPEQPEVHPGDRILEAWQSRQPPW
jgi:hypothetical protein